MTRLLMVVRGKRVGDRTVVVVQILAVREEGVNTLLQRTTTLLCDVEDSNLHNIAAANQTPEGYLLPVQFKQKAILTGKPSPLLGQWHGVGGIFACISTELGDGCLPPIPRLTSDA